MGTAKQVLNLWYLGAVSEVEDKVTAAILPCKRHHVNSLRAWVPFSVLSSPAEWTLPPEETAVKALRRQRPVPCSSPGAMKVLLMLHRMNQSVLVAMSSITKEGLLASKPTFVCRC